MFWCSHDVSFLLSVFSSVCCFSQTLLNAALHTSDRVYQSTDVAHESNQFHLQTHLFQPSANHCPLWKPQSGLAPLEAYGQALRCDLSIMLSAEPLPSEEIPDIRVVRMRRLIGLCLALWGRNPQEVEAAVLNREQKKQQQQQQDQSLHNNMDSSEQHEQMENSDNHESEAQSASVSSPMSPSDALFFRTDENFELSSPSAIRLMARKQAVSEWIRYCFASVYSTSNTTLRVDAWEGANFCHEKCSHWRIWDRSSRHHPTII